MQAVTAFAPLAAFFLAYSLRGLYVATAVLMVTMLALLAFDWLRQRRIPPLHALSALLVLLLGSATLLLHNRLFIQWKPTVLFWVVSIAFLGSSWIGGRTLTERFLSPALEGRLRVSGEQWRLLNGWSAAFYALLGALAALREEWRPRLLACLDEKLDRTVLEATVVNGPAVDGVSRLQRMTVDNLDIAVHHEKLRAIRAVVEAGYAA